MNVVRKVVLSRKTSKSTNKEERKKDHHNLKLLHVMFEHKKKNHWRSTPGFTISKSATARSTNIWDALQ